MKNIIALFILCLLVFSGAWSVLADVTFQQDSKNPKLKRVEVINVKTGGSGLVNCLGEICTIDETNMTGINWQSLNALGVAGINWTAANISGQGINWTSVSTYAASFGGAHSNVNWTSFGI